MKKLLKLYTHNFEKALTDDLEFNKFTARVISCNWTKKLFFSLTKWLGRGLELLIVNAATALKNTFSKLTGIILGRESSRICVHRRLCSPQGK